MSEMIERVIAVIETTMDAHWDNHAREYGGRMEQAVAIAVIAAMREATEAMIDAADEAQYHVTCDRQFVRREIAREWNAMIDAALTPPTNS